MQVPSFALLFERLPNDAQQSRATFRFWDILRRELLLKTVTVSEGCLTHIVLLTGLYDFTGDRNSAEHCIQWLSPTAAAHYGKDFLTTSKNDESEKLHWVPLTITSLPLPSPPPPNSFRTSTGPGPGKVQRRVKPEFRRCQISAKIGCRWCVHFCVRPNNSCRSIAGMTSPHRSRTRIHQSFSCRNIHRKSERPSETVSFRPQRKNQ